MVDGYLSLAHVQGHRPCPLAFLTTDIITREETVRHAYEMSYAKMNQTLAGYAQQYTKCNESDILSLTAMIIGAVAIARTMNDQHRIMQLLSSCRKEAGQKLGGI